MTSRLLSDPTAAAQLRRDLLLASSAHYTVYDVKAGLTRFTNAMRNRVPEPCETRVVEARS